MSYIEIYFKSLIRAPGFGRIKIRNGLSIKGDRIPGDN